MALGDGTGPTWNIRRVEWSLVRVTNGTGPEGPFRILTDSGKLRSVPSFLHDRKDSYPPQVFYSIFVRANTTGEGTSKRGRGRTREVEGRRQRMEGSRPGTEVEGLRSSRRG